ncbi:MAG: hypothetical protein ACPG7F_00085 [Aggregatilineales bacterium]
MREEINYWHHDDVDTGKRTSIELILDGDNDPKAEIRVDGEVVGTLDYHLMYGLRKQTGQMCSKCEVHYMKDNRKSVRQRFETIMGVTGDSRNALRRNLINELAGVCEQIEDIDATTLPEDITARFNALMEMADTFETRYVYRPLRNAIARVYRNYFLGTHTYIHHIDKRWHEGRDDDAE